MYMAYSNTNHSHLPRRSADASKRMTFSFGNTKAFVRFFLLAIILVAVFSCGAMVQAYAGDAATTSTNTSAVKQSPSNSNQIYRTIVQERVVIQRGDTIWEIASLHKKSGENIRSYIDKIKTINHLTTSALQEGQVLILP
ncbi:LysM peptidoglycan-binding domain-containing protein [Paenibacillus ferrarius]|uniref:LysM peptidoglycan-binding domain-containing protein n=1 Tax=Paenibacillus ferrarius TaxID=1469647 RepID=UPI001FC9FC20|nr:LysM peptidoglycan-binding domain-containing protein [Paenibacillus ferrarius]